MSQPQPSNRKPRLLAAKRKIVSLLDLYIEDAKRELKHKKDTEYNRRELAIFIRQRNKIARDAEVEEITLETKNHQGSIIYGD